jgi:hypothetical protein
MTEQGGDFDYPQSPDQSQWAPLRMRRPDGEGFADVPQVPQPGAMAPA